MVITFFGTPQFAVPTLAALLASTHRVCGVVTQPDRPRGRGHRVTGSPVKELATAHGIPVLQPERLRDSGVAGALRGWQPDLGVVAAYGKLIPEDLLAIPRLGMLNVHASLLPKYRGAAPVHRAIIDGASETGVTIMRVVRLLDAGPILARATRPIGPDETSDVVEADLARLGAALLLDVVDRLEAGPVPEEPQDDMLSTYAPRLTRQDGLLDWSLPAVYLHNRVRGLHPWPHAYTYLDGMRIILLRTRVDDTPTTQPPGTVLEVEADEIRVAAGDGQRLVLIEVQPEGRRAMRVRDFLAGHPVRPGARFTRS